MRVVFSLNGYPNARGLCLSFSLLYVRSAHGKCADEMSPGRPLFSLVVSLRQALRLPSERSELVAAGGSNGHGPTKGPTVALL
jgi:hypothetical protein